MKKLSLVIGLALLSSNFALAKLPSDLGIIKTSTDKTKAFTKESTTVIFTAKIRKNIAAKNPKLVLLQVNEKGEKEKYLGILSDDGVMGDKKKHDGVYSRKIQMYSKKGSVKYLAVAEEVEGIIPERVASMENAIRFDILYRPSFIELMQRVFTTMESNEENLEERKDS